MAAADYDYRIWRNGELIPNADVLGGGRLRIVPKRCHASLMRFWTDEKTGEESSLEYINLDPFQHLRRPEWRGEFEGYQFVIVEYENYTTGHQWVDMELIEPDGTRWEGTSGYHYPPDEYGD